MKNLVFWLSLFCLQFAYAKEDSILRKGVSRLKKGIDSGEVGTILSTLKRRGSSKAPDVDGGPLCGNSNERFSQSGLASPITRSDSQQSFTLDSAPTRGASLFPVVQLLEKEGIPVVRGGMIPRGLIRPLAKQPSKRPIDKRDDDQKLSIEEVIKRLSDGGIPVIGRVPSSSLSRE